MSLYHINEGTFDLPDEWMDRSMNIFTPDASDTPEWNIVVSRDKLDEGETLEDYLEKQLEEMPKALPRFQLKSNEEITVDDYPARKVISTWIGEKGTLRQKQIVLVKDGKSLVFTFTVLERLNNKYENVLDNFIESFQVRS
ncbi:MAG: DUF1795 domain-containing protein [Acidobacteriota bacterium]|nr:DUF1795 domain-containing protein [Acidobacteriota bacterium]